MTPCPVRPKRPTLPDSFTVDGKPWDVLWLRQTHIPHTGRDEDEEWGGMACSETRQVFVCMGTAAEPRPVHDVLLSYEHERLHVALLHAGVNERLGEDEHKRVAGALLEMKLSAGTVDLRAWDAALRQARGGNRHIARLKKRKE